ncbi:hypothetical protein ACFC01_18095 [Streptomyces mirabilis]|uniref:hypothetical protein n=1 Tax=Streptomyces mirabilis TaxID=68239 RepID=UPI0035DDFB34
MTEQPNAADALYLDAEHFDLTARSRPLEPGARVVPIGEPLTLLPSALTPTPEDIAAWLRDPRNRVAVAEVLAREARAGAPWLREFIARENRIHRRPQV